MPLAVGGPGHWQPVSATARAESQSRSRVTLRVSHRARVTVTYGRPRRVPVGTVTATVLMIRVIIRLDDDAVVRPRHAPATGPARAWAATGAPARAGPGVAAEQP